jgi:hypothetical protein
MRNWVVQKNQTTPSRAAQESRQATHSENRSGTEKSQQLSVLRSDLGAKLDFGRWQLRNRHEKKNSDNGTCQRAQQLDRDLGTETAVNTTEQEQIRSSVRTKGKMNSTLKI